jgi:hypothetical protein
MGTRNNPGAFNCYAAALPDETIFTVLARDPAMPGTIRFWIGERARLGKNVTPEDIKRLGEAAEVADAAEAWRAANLNPMGDGVPTWKLPRQIVDDDDPVRTEPVKAVSPYDAGQVVRKVVVGLRQITESMGEDSLFGTRTVQNWQDRINGFAAELADLGIVDDRTTEPAPAMQDEGDLEVVEEHPPTVDSAPQDLAHAPEVPGHRFSQFVKHGRYAYARGLEIAPIHLPRALEAMAEDGWRLVAIFGQTDSEHIGLIFERVPRIVNHIGFGDTRCGISESDRENLRQIGEERPGGACDMGRGQEP